LLPALEANIFARYKPRRVIQKRSHALLKLSSRDVLSHWTSLIRPFFPSDANITCGRSGSRISVRRNDDRPFVIVVGYAARQEYEAAGEAEKSRADQKLLALLVSSLVHYQPERTGLPHSPVTEFYMTVSAKDVF
jgi:hypothetical protein